MDNLGLRYEERAQHAKNPAAKQLFELMSYKKTNLTFSDDETDPDRFLELADLMGPEIAVLKTHIDILESFVPDITKRLSELANEHNFMIFEDRKLADIGNTSVLQYTKGIYRIADWANFVNVHVVSGPGIIDGIGKANEEMRDSISRGIIILSQMSTEGNLASGNYTLKATEFAKKYEGSVAGHIGNGGNASELAKLSKLCVPGHILFTPGVNIEKGGDGKGQIYSSPDMAIAAGSDTIIVGRGIYGTRNPVNTAKTYRDAGWTAYTKRIKK